MEGVAGEAANLDAALTAAHIGVGIRMSHELTAMLEELSNYEAIVLVDVPAKALPQGAMEVLQAYVRDWVGGWWRSAGIVVKRAQMGGTTKKFTAQISWVLLRTGQGDAVIGFTPQNSRGPSTVSKKMDSRLAEDR